MKGTINKMRTNIKIILYMILIISSQLSVNSYGQVFTKITDANNPVVSDGTSGFYIGASWIDFDNDGLLDLYVSRQVLYRNLGNGNFEKITTALANQGPVQGNSWADYDNDGDIDCFVVTSASNDSYLYRNDGGGIFTKITSGLIGDAVHNSGWGCSWADYNNDGYVDLVIAAPNDFGIVNHPSRFYENNGDGTFSRIDTTLFTTQLAPYTVPTWSDYDLDGDIDLFIGSGPATGILARDYLFKNLLKETGNPYLDRIDTSIIGTDLVDGQVWNWIDYDNDGDMDAFLTNYKSAEPNNLYRNEGNQYFIKTTSQQVGTIVSDPGLGLTNVWGDFDNDGALDCIVTNDDFPNRYYKNNNDGTFTRIFNLEITAGNGPHFGITAGDYNKDGFLDLYIAGTNQTKGLFRNDSHNGHSWVNIKCIGVGGSTGSNFSAIGTKIKAKTTINGNPVWQIREVSSQNSFNAMNMLNVHFGFGDAVIIDSLVIEWTRGIKDVYINVEVNKFYEAVEGIGISLVTPVNDELHTNPSEFNLFQNYPNPFNPSTTISYSLPQEAVVSILIYNMIGQKIRTLIDFKDYSAGMYETNWNGRDDFGKEVASGTYIYRMHAGDIIKSRKLILLR